MIASIEVELRKLRGKVRSSPLIDHSIAVRARLPRWITADDM